MFKVSANRYIKRQGNNMKGKSMVEGTPWKHILRFALPVLAGSLLQQLYNTVDTIVVGNFSGEDALSAVGTTGSNLYGAEHWCRENGQSEKRSLSGGFHVTPAYPVHIASGLDIFRKYHLFIWAECKGNGLLYCPSENHCADYYCFSTLYPFVWCVPGSQSWRRPHDSCSWCIGSTGTRHLFISI